MWDDNIKVIGKAIDNFRPLYCIKIEYAFVDKKHGEITSNYLGMKRTTGRFENMTLRRHATLLMVQFEKCKKGRKDCGFEEVATFFVMCLFILDLFKIRVNTIPFLRLTFHIKSTIQLQ